MASLALITALKSPPQMPCLAASRRRLGRTLPARSSLSAIPAEPDGMYTFRRVAPFTSLLKVSTVIARCYLHFRWYFLATKVLFEDHNDP